MPKTHIHIFCPQVISGCEWGNILVWDDALIKVEITRRDGKPCHNGVIHKFHLEEGELISLGKTCRAVDLVYI